MFKNTRKVLREMWNEPHIYRDPAPMIWESTVKEVKDIAKAMYKDVKDILKPDQD